MLKYKILKKKRNFFYNKALTLGWDNSIYLTATPANCHQQITYHSSTYSSSERKKMCAKSSVYVSLMFFKVPIARIVIERAGCKDRLRVGRIDDHWCRATGVSAGGIGRDRTRLDGSLALNCETEVIAGVTITWLTWRDLCLSRYRSRQV